MQSDHDTVGGRLDHAMRSAGLESQSELARKSGVPQPTISRILKNGGEPESGTVKKLASVLGVPFDWLNEGTGAMGTDVVSIRRQRLSEWTSGRGGLPSREKSYFSQLIGGKAPFGEKAARRIEQQYGLDCGFFDKSVESDELRDSVIEGIVAELQTLSLERLQTLAAFLRAK